MKTKRVSDEPKVVSPAVAAFAKGLVYRRHDYPVSSAGLQHEATSLFQWGHGTIKTGRAIHSPCSRPSNFSLDMNLPAFIAKARHGLFVSRQSGHR